MNQYYGLQGGLSFKTFLRHFENQANGTANLELMRNRNSLKGDTKFKRPTVNNSLILVSLASSENANRKNERQPAIEVYDEAESARLRALDKAMDESEHPPHPPSKRGRPGRKAHSNSGGGRRQIPAGTTGKSAAKKTVKRAENIFEP